MRRLLFWTAIFILGVLTGAALTSVLIGNRIDTLYMENRILQDNLLAADKQIKQLQESHRVKKRVISNITTYVEFAEKNDYTDLEINNIELNVEKHVRELLGIISGQVIDDVNYLLIPNIIENREMEFENRKIRLKVNLVVISETVIVYVKVKPI
ncbi:MAG: hypothetical protein PHC92_08065 [Syntrophomonadaceae bacterium]|nr:hypothetical protein [Syntrophomonadaceae bacterium]MDD3023414.1 hypothetical protein [Syntrophomonadaceae bacterium]